MTLDGAVTFQAAAYATACMCELNNLSCEYKKAADKSINGRVKQYYMIM